MSKRYWNGTIAPWLMVVLGLTLIGFASWQFSYALGYQAANQRHDTERASEYVANKDYQRCLSETSVKDAIGCYQSANKATHEEQRADANLSAQRQMADWTKVSLWISAIIGSVSLFVTAIGVYLVLETLWETRRIGNAQVRAYVSWSNHRIQSRFHNESGSIADITIIGYVKNTGLSPGRVTGMWIAYSLQPLEGQKQITFDLERSVCDHEIGADNEFHFIRQTIPIAEAYDIYSGAKSGYLIGWYSYRHLFQKPDEPPIQKSFGFRIYILSDPRLFTKETDIAANIELINEPTLKLNGAKPEWIA